MPSNISGETIITIPGTISGDGENNSLTGTALNDSLFGYGGDDTLLGNDGDDYLNGGLGDDLMRGGNGNDRYVVDSHQDQVVETANGGTDDWAYVYVNNYVLPDFVENMTLFGNVYSAHGNSLDNIIRGNAGHNYLTGGGGEDTFYGLIGDDFYVVDSAGDKVIEYANTLYEDHGVDTVLTYIDNYRLPENVERLRLGGTANLKGFGNELDNTIIGNSGDNIIDGGLGHDNVFAGAGHDILKLNTDKTTNHYYFFTNDRSYYEEDASFSGVEEIHVDGGDGYTYVHAELFSDGQVRLRGNGGDDYLVGTHNADYLDGGSGNDTLLGKSGNDVFVANGSDWIDGGHGFDLAQYQSNLRTIQIEDTHIRSGDEFINPDDEVATLNNIERLTVAGGNDDNSFDAYRYSGGLLLAGRGGNDYFRVLDVADHSINGGSGDDTLYFEYAGNTTILNDELIAANTTNFRNVELLQLVAYTESDVHDVTLDGSEYTEKLFLQGTTGNDVIIGGTGNDSLVGKGGADRLIGGAGDDVLYGSSSLGVADLLTGGSGQDRFVLGNESISNYVDFDPSTPGYNDVGIITDFSQTDDIIQLHGSADEYRLGMISVHGYQGVGIFAAEANPTTQDLVGLIQGDTTGLELNASYFDYV